MQFVSGNFPILMPGISNWNGQSLHFISLHSTSEIIPARRMRNSFCEIFITGFTSVFSGIRQAIPQGSCISLPLSGILTIPHGTISERTGPIPPGSSLPLQQRCSNLFLLLSVQSIKITSYAKSMTAIMAGIRNFVIREMRSPFDRDPGSLMAIL